MIYCNQLVKERTLITETTKGQTMSDYDYDYEKIEGTDGKEYLVANEIDNSFIGPDSIKAKNMLYEYGCIIMYKNEELVDDDDDLSSALDAIESQY